MKADVAVVGGGVSGLSAAFELACRGHRVIVLEREAHAGGKARSERIGDFLIEHGPTAVGTEEAIEALTLRLGLGCARVDLRPKVRRRYIAADGRLQGISVHPAGFLTSAFLSVAGRLRLLAEAAVPRRVDGAEETVAAFCRRRFGVEFADRVMDALVCGMFAGSADRLSIAATFPRLVEMERRHGSVLRGVLAARLSGKGMPARRLHSWQNGVATLPMALAERLGARVRVGVAVQRILSRPQGFSVQTSGRGEVEADAVLLATPAHAAAGLLKDVDAAAAAALAAIDAPPLAVVHLGYARAQVAHALDGIGYLAPGRECRPVNGALFCSSMFPGRAPPGFISLAAYIGGDRAPALARLPADELIGMARAELTSLLGIDGPPVLARVRRWPRGLPQYRIGHGSILTELDAASRRRPGLFLTGNYSAGVSVAACVGHATLAARRVDTFLRRRALSASALPPEIRAGVEGTVPASGWTAVEEPHGQVPPAE